MRATTSAARDPYAIPAEALDAQRRIDQLEGEKRGVEPGHDARQPHSRR
jgi:hypothetical protein